MNPIREFFKRKATDKKFKSAGPAQKLKDSASSSGKEKESQPSTSKSSHAHKPSREAERAGAAAQERIQQQQQSLNWSSKAIKNQAKKELELENSQKESKVLPVRQASKMEDVCRDFTVSGVYFTCPIIDPEVLPKKDIEDKIRAFLYEQLEQEAGLAACLIILTLNKNKLLVQKGVETLARYLTNIIDEPTEEKYRKIRLKNKIFQERVAELEGALDFLKAAGFSLQSLKSKEENEEEYLVLEDENLDVEKLQMLKEAILSAEPILPQLDRNLKVLKPTQVVETVNLPQDFYNLTLEEIKREQEARTDTVEMLSQLRTKAMRERESQNRNVYKYSLIRVRFPNGIILQGTFSVREKLSAVKEFVAKNLIDPTKDFELLIPGDNKQIDDSQSLLELKLMPAVILNYRPVAESPGSCFLNSECMSLLSDL